MKKRFAAACWLLLGFTFAAGCSQSKPEGDSANQSAAGDAQVVAFDPGRPAVTLSVPGMT